MKIPISLLVDDGAPVNLMHFHDPPEAHALLLPNSLVRDFAELCDEHEVRGKFSVVPMPGCLGDINGRLNRVPQRHLSVFLKIIRERIAPRFDITPEILTHHAAYRIEKGGFFHLYEDEWVARASVDEMTDYFVLALEILADVGLPANGMTSPWNTGIQNEAEYAQAIGAAQWRAHKRKLTWYFLHVLPHGLARPPSLGCRDSGTGQVVVSIPATTADAFWDTQRPRASTKREALAAAKAGVDSWLTADGRGGRIPELIGQGNPIALLTHWQSLYSDGTLAGLHGLGQFLARLRRHHGSDLEWVTCSELAERVAAEDSGCQWSVRPGGN